MKKQLALLFGCLIAPALQPTSLILESTVIPFEEQQASYATAVAGLSGLFGDRRADAAAALSDDLTTFISAVTGCIADAAPETPDALIMRLNGVITAATTSKNLSDDQTLLGGLEQDLANALYLLATIDVSKTASENHTVLAAAETALFLARTAYDPVYSHGFPSESSPLKTGSGWETLLDDRARAQSAFLLFASIPALNGALIDLEAAQAGEPDPADDSLLDFDTSYLAAQDAIATSATTLKNCCTTMAEKATLLAETDRASATEIDCVADASAAVSTKVTQIHANATAILKKVAMARKDIALRVLQRQLLFDVSSFAAKQTLKAVIRTAVNEQTTAASDLAAAATAISSVLTMPAPTFEATPPPAAPEGERTVMGTIVDEKAVEFSSNIEDTIRRLFPSPPSQEIVDAITATLRPAVYVQVISSTMTDWLTDRANGITEALNGEEDTSDYEREWDELKAVLEETLLDTGLSDSAVSMIQEAMATDAFTSLFPEDGSSASFRINVNTLTKRPSGPLRRILSIGTNEFQRLIVGLLAQIQSGSVTKPSTVARRATIPVPTPSSVPESPDATIDSTSILTTTLEDGSNILITGSGPLAARLRDPVFDSLVDKLSADFKIFMNQSARIGLGSANISTSPGQTPNVLGGSDVESENSIQLIPDGNCFVDVNSDLLISGSKPIIPTENFGTDTHRITFYSEVPRSITITANTTWDLTDFGMATDDYVEYGKQIVFAGKVSLVLEPGAKIRFPLVDPTHTKKTVVLYFNDDAQLIFQGDQLTIGRPWVDEDIAGTDCKKNKILGMGEIWLNKAASLTIYKPALVGIEADYTTPHTDITISLQRNASLSLGTQSINGGALQIGNMFDGGSKANPESEDDVHFPNNANNPDEDFVPHVTTIDFTLKIDGNAATCTIGRQGFLGFAVGVINKDGAPASSNAGPNGAEGISHSAWQLQRLYNVGNITIDVTQGIFDHSIIADGQNANCSLLAVGKLAQSFPSSKYILKIGDTRKAIVKGGGNLYFVDKEAAMIVNSEGFVTAVPHTVAIADAAFDLGFTLSNSGKYAPLAPHASIKNHSYSIPGITAYSMWGRGIMQSAPGTPYALGAPAEEFFSALKMNPYSDTFERAVPISTNGTASTICYVANNTIYRQPLRPADLRDGTAAQAAQVGYIRGEKQANGKPTRFSLATE